MNIPSPSPAWRHSAVIALWLLVWLAVIDIAVNLAFDRGIDAPRPSALSRYFEYGRSVEGKLTRMVAADPKGGGQMISPGWIDPRQLSDKPGQAKEGQDLLMAVYGPSFALNAANEAVALDKRIALRDIGAPGAPPSHSYAAYKEDAPLRKADVAVFGVLSSGVPLMGSMSGLIWLFESPAPYTYPRYRIVDGRLTEEQPLIRNEAEFRRAFEQRTSGQWAAFREQLRRSDRGYDAFTFDASIADRSSIVRLVRRGWVAHRQPYDDGVYSMQTGFDEKAEEVRALKVMVLDLKQRSCSRGERLIVLLLHTQRQSDHLYRMLGATLDQAGIEYVSTHTLFSANDARNFVPDGHYTEEANRALARELLKRVRAPARPGHC